MTAPTSALWDLPGQDRAATLLQTAVRRGEVGHAWAFVGMAGVGQGTAARSLAAELNCARQPACGTCGDCARALRGTHPAYREFAPTGAFHRVTDVREQWLPAAFTTAVAGGTKVLRIIDADRMNEPAANAFLKGLEEPPSSTVWVLELADPADLPDTIISRCRVVPFRPAPARVLDDELRRSGGLQDADRELAVRAALGSPATLRRLVAPRGLDDYRAHRSAVARLRADGPGHALVVTRYLADESKRHSKALKAEVGRELETLTDAYGDQPPRSVVREIEERARRRERDIKIATVQHALDDLMTWIRDCLLVGSGGPEEAVINHDIVESLGEDAAAISPRVLLGAADQVLVVRESLEVNVQPALAVEAFLLRVHADMAAS